MKNIVERIANLVNGGDGESVIELCYYSNNLNFQVFVNEIEFRCDEDMMVLECEDSSSFRIKISSIKDIIYIEEIFDFYQINFSDNSYLEIRSL